MGLIRISLMTKDARSGVADDEIWLMSTNMSFYPQWQWQGEWYTPALTSSQELGWLSNQQDRA